MSNQLFVGVSFALTWAVVIGYLIHLRRVRRRALALAERAAKGAGR